MLACIPVSTNNVAHTSIAHVPISLVKLSAQLVFLDNAICQFQYLSNTGEATMSPPPLTIFINATGTTEQRYLLLKS